MNAQYFENLTQQIDNINSCSELQRVADKIMASLADEVAGIEAQVAALAPIAALLTAPTNPAEILTWVGNFITGVLTPQYAPVAKYAAELPLLLAAIADLASAIEQAADRIPNCSVTIPPVT